MTPDPTHNPYLIHPLAEHERPLTWARTREYMRIDYGRNVEHFGGKGSLFTRFIWQLMPNVLAVRLYRLSRYFYVNGWFKTALTLFLINQFFTRTELPPTASIGPGCLIGHAEGITLYGRIGAYFTAHGFAGTGGGYGQEDVGGGPGYPCVGDHVSMAHFAIAQGPIRIGDHVRFGPYAHVTKDVPEHALVIAPPCRIQRRTVAGSTGAEASAGADSGSGADSGVAVASGSADTATGNGSGTVQPAAVAASSAAAAPAGDGTTSGSPSAHAG